MTQNYKLLILKINKSAFIWNFVKKKGMQNCNLVKANNFIKMQDDNYIETNFKLYQQLISKLIYF